MKILIVSAWCPFPADNGSRLRAYHLLRELAAQGHRLTLIALCQEDNDPDIAHPALETFCAGGVELFPSRFFRAGTWKAWLGLFSRRPRMLLDTWQPDAARAIARACQSKDYDAILALQMGIAHYIPARTAAPCLLDEVEVSSILRGQTISRSLPGRLRRMLMTAKFRAHVVSQSGKFARWTTVSTQERDAILAAFGTHAAPPIAILPNGVDLAFNTPGGAYDPNILIYNGALSFYANYDAVNYFVQEILPHIQKQRPDVRLIVTGRTDTLAPNDMLRHHASVVLTGYVDDIRPVMRNAAVCVVPLRQGGGTRLKILEAMALGVPVVATTRAAEGIDATHGEHLLIADAPVEFARETLRLMADPDARAVLAAGGRRLVEQHYGWDAIGAHLARILQESTIHCPRS